MMLCFMDKTFCENEKCDCGYPKFTQELSVRAELWWNPKDEPEKRGSAPVCFVIHEAQK